MKTVLAGALLFVLCAAPALAGVSLLYYVGYGLYPHSAIDTASTAPGTGLLANNGSGRALVQLIYAGPDYQINPIDLDNDSAGHVSGDDVVWQSTVIEMGTNEADEWGFSNIPLAYTNPAWATAGFVYVRVFQDDTPQNGEAFYDTPLLALNTGNTLDGIFSQWLPIGAATEGVALDQRMIRTANLVRAVEAGQWDLMSVPLNISPSNKFGLIASNAAVASRVYFYDPTNSTFAGGSKSTKGWSAAQSNRMILPGESYFLKSPPETGHAIAIAGEVPVGPVTNRINENLSALGYPYPVEIAWKDTALFNNLPAGSLVYFWDRLDQQYRTYRKGAPAKGVWSSAASNHIIQPGDGFFVRQPAGATPFNWIE